MLEKTGHPTIISNEAALLESAEKVIIPGVGSFDYCMSTLNQSGISDCIRRLVMETKIPVLGICLGMQILTGSSEEGWLPGLNLIDARTVRFDFSSLPDQPKIPHMGWNGVSVQKESALFESMDPEAEFYFTHSYHLAASADIVAGTSWYGYDFPSVIEQNNIWAVQFHPEKSHKYGLRLLQNFIELI